MQLSISNIGWLAEDDDLIYKMMLDYRLSGLEIAPTRIFPSEPYEQLNNAQKWAEDLLDNYGFNVSSMQSIWYGRQESIFGTEEEKNELISYTKKAIIFAEKIGCHNLVFGCPRNRNIKNNEDYKIAVVFFKVIGDFAAEHNTCIGMEANPSIYNTNFINDTASALQLIKDVSSEGFKLNLDVGTMIKNEENIDVLNGNVCLINHVHISEPFLKPIEKRELHKDLADLLRSEKYKGFVSIEMGKVDDMNIISKALKYVREVFA